MLQRRLIFKNMLRARRPSQEANTTPFVGNLQNRQIHRESRLVHDGLGGRKNCLLMVIGFLSGVTKNFEIR